jgi:glycosyltransferase involved in cell wall biosynthesis
MTKMQLLPISVCIIAGNEASRIRRALESIVGWTSEIVVVLNDDVNDGTDKIAEEFGAKIFREPWKGHIAQKNSAAQKAAGPWILGLDSDEVVSPELRTEIQNLFLGSGKSSGATAYSFPRCTFYCGRWIRHGDWYPDRQTRLWQRGQAEWGGVDPHDKLLVRGSVGKLKSDLYHLSNDSVNTRIQKIISYTDEFARQHSRGTASPVISGLIIRPGWRFFRAYLLRLGFLDGWQGLFIAWLNTFSTASKYAKMRERESHPRQ